MRQVLALVVCCWASVTVAAGRGHNARSEPASLRFVRAARMLQRDDDYAAVKTKLRAIGRPTSTDYRFCNEAGCVDDVSRSDATEQWLRWYAKQGKETICFAVVLERGLVWSAEVSVLGTTDSWGDYSPGKTYYSAHFQGHLAGVETDSYAEEEEKAKSREASDTPPALAPKDAPKTIPSTSNP